MPKSTDIRVIGARLYFLPIVARVPLKFGHETVTEVTCARVHVRVCDRGGRTGEGWGETPLSVTWVWPSHLSYSERHERLKQFCVALTETWPTFDVWGHPIEIGYEFQEQVLPGLAKKLNEQWHGAEAMPWLAALVCSSAFDIAVHDAYGQMLGGAVYETY